MFSLELNKYFHKHEVVGQGGETQLQVVKNLNYFIQRFMVVTSRK